MDKESGKGCPLIGSEYSDRAPGPEVRVSLTALSSGGCELLEGHKSLFHKTLSIIGTLSVALVVTTRAS